MKIKTILSLVAIALFSIVNNVQAQENDYSLAKVGKKLYGVYIFVMSEPYHDYDYIATVEAKVNWSGTLEESFEKVISKAKKKYPNFNGIVFHSNDLDKADIIRFKGLEVSRGGIAIGAKVSFIKTGQVYYGEVIELESSKNKGSVKYIDIFEEEQVRKMSYTDMTILSEEGFAEKKKTFQVEINKYKFKVGEKVAWVANKKTLFGEVVSLDSKAHKAAIKHLNKFGDEKTLSISYLNLTRLTEADYQEKLQAQKEEIAKHTFKVGDKVSWVKSDLLNKNSKQIIGEVIELNDTYHKASIKYKDENNEEKIAKVSYLDLTKE